MSHSERVTRPSVVEVAQVVSRDLVRTDSAFDERANPAYIESVDDQIVIVQIEKCESR
jgi:hypothetical protein